MPPSFILIIGALLLPLVSKNIRSLLIVTLPLLTLYSLWQPFFDVYPFRIGEFALDLFHIHPYSLIFGTIFALAAFAGGVFALKQMQKDGVLEISSAYIYAGSAIGVVFSGDYISLFLYWELMAVASTIVVLCGRTAKARAAAIRYAYMHFFGGVILLIGIIGYIHYTGSAQIVPISINVWEVIQNPNVMDISIILILIGFLVNAAAPPFSAWLADAYPESSPTGAVFLSAFTTKTAVFVLLTIFAGTEILIYIGMFMVFYGIIYAMLENDMRRILSYSIINQVGFMIVGIGIGTTMSQSGVAAHAFCHIIYKALLLMSAGSVIFMTGKHKCSEVGGLWHSMKYTAICGIIGAMAISAFPWTSGFVSKSLISSSAANEQMMVVWFLLAAASAGVFLHAGIKFPWFVFFQKDSGLRPEEPPMTMRLSMLFLSFMCIVPGLFPEFLYALLPEKVDYEPYTTTHIVTQLQLLLWAGLAFFVALPWLKRTNTISLDMDWIYRVFLRNALLVLENGVYQTIGGVKKWGIISLQYFHEIIYQNHQPTGIMARAWSLYTTLICAAIMLGVFLIMYLI